MLIGVFKSTVNMNIMYHLSFGPVSQRWHTENLYITWCVALTERVVELRGNAEERHEK